MKQTHNSSPIPEITSREEEAAWWDSHDLSDYWDQFKPVKVRFDLHLSESLNMRLDPATMNGLRKQAQKQGVGPTTLARMWIKERLTQPTREVR